MLFTKSQKQQALQLAQESISFGLSYQKPLEVNASAYDEVLQQQGCCFVTLHKNSSLRGCIGALQPSQALICDIAEHAYSAAFKDYRFSPVVEDELPNLTIHISVLSPQQSIQFTSEADLLRQLKPHEDGLTIEDSYRRATFLPSVWEQLPEKEQFLLHLKRKAGIADNEWPNSIQAFRYHTVTIGE